MSLCVSRMRNELSGLKFAVVESAEVMLMTRDQRFCGLGQSTLNTVRCEALYEGRQQCEAYVCVGAVENSVFSEGRMYPTSQCLSRRVWVSFEMLFANIIREYLV